ncbi:unnamed protein product [Protopolystoma xenopodis]|uniref:Uncharacterized protein n=1 Tax=Protopolystoma xenopodis TaxID=117903 RepID=A0A448XHL9_9PLAT|nr:unnamed protein product [Protopolystoma xenopodis]
MALAAKEREREANGRRREQREETLATQSVGQQKAVEGRGVEASVPREEAGVWPLCGRLVRHSKPNSYTRQERRRERSKRRMSAEEKEEFAKAGSTASSFCGKVTQSKSLDRRDIKRRRNVSLPLCEFHQ